MMKKYRKLMLVALMILSFTLNSQSTFSKIINFTNGNEGGYQLVYHDDNYYLGCYGIVFDTIENLIYYSQHFYLLKVDSNLDVTNNRMFIPPYQVSKSLYNNDTLYLFGQDVTNSQFSWRVYKFNQDLDSLDLLIYDNFKYEKEYSITFQINDDYLFYGSYNGSNARVLFIKSDKKGNIIKQETFPEYIDTTKKYFISDLSHTSDGQFAFVHWHKFDSLYSGKHQIGVIKFDDNMNVIWAKDLPILPSPGGGGAKLPNLTTTDNGGMVVSFGIDLRDSIINQPEIYGDYSEYGLKLYKLDTVGEIEWSDLSYNRKIPGYWFGIAPMEIVNKLITAQNGDIIAAGVYDHPFSEPGVKGWICRYSPDGKMKWKHYYVDPFYSGNSSIRDIAEAENGDIVCIGEIREEYGEFNNNIFTWLLRVDSNGCVTPGCECEPDSNTKVWATTEAYKILVNTPNVWYQADWSISGQDVMSYRYKLSNYWIKNNYAFGVLKSDEPTGENWDTTGILLRQVGGKVWMYEDNDNPPHYDYKLLYDFTLEKGDTFRSEIFEDDKFYLLVEDTDTVTMLDGTKRKRLKLSCNNESDTVNYSDYKLRTWLEGIGDTKGLLSVASSCLADQSSALLCYYQKGDEVWDNPDQDGCWITRTEEIVENAFDIYPNPTKDMIKVTLHENSNWQRWQIYDLTGKLRKNGSVNNSFDFTISGLEELGSGMYFLKVYDDKGRVGVGKFVVE